MYSLVERYSVYAWLTNISCHDAHASLLCHVGMAVQMSILCRAKHIVILMKTRSFIGDGAEVLNCVGYISLYQKRHESGCNLSIHCISVHAEQCAVMHADATNQGQL